MDLDSLNVSHHKLFKTLRRCTPKEYKYDDKKIVALYSFHTSESGAHLILICIGAGTVSNIQDGWKKEYKTRVMRGLGGGSVDKGFNANSYGKMVAIVIKHVDKPKQIFKKQQ
jgi:hypothetical protein